MIMSWVDIFTFFSSFSNSFSTGKKYNGSGINVMMQDDGIIGPHIDYQGRIDQTNVNSNGGNHGDHVAGIIMGAGNLDPIAKGMADGVELFVYSSSNNNNTQSLDNIRIRIITVSYTHLTLPTNREV